MTDEEHKVVKDMIATVEFMCFFHDRVKPHRWKDLSAAMKSLGEFFEARQRSETLKDSKQCQ
jgi:hypothetical protein